jgi:hypothetical protein
MDEKELRELDNFLAEKLMGWHPPNHEMTVMFRQQTRMTHSAYDYYWCSPAHQIARPPRYSSDIASAMLVEAMIKERGLEAKYVWQLIKVTQGRTVFPSNINDLIPLVYATALQRCSAAKATLEER